LILSLGLFLFFLSNCFVAYSNYTGCAIYFSLKNIGISLLLIIEYIYIIIASNLGVLNEEDVKFKFVNKEYTSNIDIFTSFSSQNIKGIASEPKIHETLNENQTTQELDKKINSSSNKRLSKKWTITSNVDNYNDLNNTEKSYIINDNINGSNIDNVNKQKQWNNNHGEHNKHKIYKHIKRSVKQVHIILVEVYSLYPVYFCSLILLAVIYYFSNSNSYDNIIQTEMDGKWIYKCKMEDTNIIYTVVHFLMLLAILINGRKTSNLECVFKCTKYITYSIYVGIALGPSVSVSII